MKVLKPGFKTYLAPQVVLEPGRDLAMTAKLQMGVLEDTVDVQAEYRGQPYAMKTMPSTETTAEPKRIRIRSEEHTSELQSRLHLVCRLLLEKKKKLITDIPPRPRLRN